MDQRPKAQNKPFQFAPDVLAKFNEAPIVGNAGPGGEWYSDDRAEIKAYLLTIDDMAKRRSESKRIQAIREDRRKNYQARIRQGDAYYDRAARKARIAAGIPAAKHAASRDVGNQAMRNHVKGYRAGLRLRALGYRTPAERIHKAANR